MQVESYARSDLVRQAVSQDEDYARLVDAAGFNSYQTGLMQKIAHKLNDATALFTELSDKEIKVWCRFLPNRRPPHHYDFDLPPTEVLEIIRDVRELDLFDTIEIWTPVGNTFSERFAKAREKTKRSWMQRLDPMAVGIIRAQGKTHCFPIVRWGEALQPYNKIRKNVRKVNIALFFACYWLVWLGLAFNAGVAALATAVNEPDVYVISVLSIVLLFPGIAFGTQTFRTSMRVPYLKS